MYRREARTVDTYPRLLHSGFTPFDPLQVAYRTEEIVGQKGARKYSAFYCVGVYGGISSAYAVGCCLRCVYCWSDSSRDYPEKHGSLYTPDEVVDRLVENAQEEQVRRLRISGGEPTLGKHHLLAVLDRVELSGYQCVVETNGILVAADEDLAEEMAWYDCTRIRLSLKAGTAEGFEARTGARGEFWELPFLAVERLLAAGADLRVAAMTDPGLMPEAERDSLLDRLHRTGYVDPIEEEWYDSSHNSMKRLRAAGWDPL
jgi:uncharacterized Fe-S cluster-containing radical SAM superfamily protein